MTKKDMVIKIAEDTELKQIDVKRIVQKTLDHIVEALTKGETVELRNFGIFKVRSRKSRVGRNPKNCLPRGEWPYPLSPGQRAIQQGLWSCKKNRSISPFSPVRLSES